MLLSHSHRLLSFPFPFSHSYNPLLSLPLNFIHRPTSLHSVSAHSRPRPDPWLAQAAEPTTPTTTTAEEGPVELPSFSNSIFADTDDPSPIQVATSVLLTGAVSVFLFRSLRRRAKRAKELKFRSSGAKESSKEEAMDSLKAMGSASIEAKSPSSALQALFGGISAGIIALILYKFTTTIEAALNRQTISDNFSGELIFFIKIRSSILAARPLIHTHILNHVQQITITIRTIVNGLCYLATFVFGINSVGLFLYSGQLALNSFMEDSSTKNKGEEEQLSSPDVTARSPGDGNVLNDNNRDQSSDDNNNGRDD